MCLDPHLNWGWGWRRWTGLGPPVGCFADRSGEVLLLWIFCVFVLSCVCYVLCASVYMCFLVTCWERADLLALVCGVFCEFVTFPLVSWVRCGTWLYRFLIFAPLLTFIINCFWAFWHRPPPPPWSIMPYLYDVYNVKLQQCAKGLVWSRGGGGGGGEALQWNLFYVLYVE